MAAEGGTSFENPTFEYPYGDDLYNDDDQFDETTPFTRGIWVARKILR